MTDSLPTSPQIKELEKLICELALFEKHDFKAGTATFLRKELKDELAREKSKLAEASHGRP
jgi:hypothetical protein